MTSSSHQPFDVYIQKLERRGPLPPSLRDALLSLPTITHQAAPHDTITKEGGTARHSLFLVSGFVSRQRRVNGRANIIAFGIPGDAVDLQSLWFDTFDHSLVAHTASTFVSVAHEDIIALCAKFPSITGALWHDTLVDAAIFREWTINVGHRRARLRLAHLFLELAARFEAAGIGDGRMFECPVTQSDMASALGLSLVHFNKSLAALRADGLIDVRGRTFIILERDALAAATGFDPAYLHLSAPPSPPVDRVTETS